MKKSKMQMLLTKVLSTMKISNETKVIIAISLVSDIQIGSFFEWLKDEVPEDKITEMEYEIAGKAIEINKGWDILC